MVLPRNKQSTRYFSKKQEDKVAKTLGGKVQANSGATRFDKGDVVTDVALIECKTAMKPKKQFTIQKQWLEDIKRERFEARKQVGAVVFDFGDEDDQFAVIPLQNFNEYLDYLRNEV